MVRFRGTLRAIEAFGKLEPPAAREGEGQGAPRRVASCAYSLAMEPDFRAVVKIFVESVEPNPDIQQGAVLSLALESVAKSLGANAAVGTTADLELVVESSDGVFCGLEVLRPRSSASPQPFEGHLVVGGTYRVPVEWDPAAKATVLAEEVALPFHYGGSFEWVNPEAVKELNPDLPQGHWVLEVRSVEAESLGADHFPRYWMTHKCRFIALEPCRACAAPR